MSMNGDETLRELEAALAPERDINKHDIRPKRRSLAQRIRACRRDPRNRESFSLEQRSSCLQEVSIVVDD